MKPKESIIKIRNIFFVCCIIFVNQNLYSKTKINKSLFVTVIPLEMQFKKSKRLHEDVVLTLNKYSFIKYTPSKVVDREKKRLSSVNIVDFDGAMSIAAKLKTDIAIILYEDIVTALTNTTTNSIETNISPKYKLKTVNTKSGILIREDNLNQLTDIKSSLEAILTMLDMYFAINLLRDINAPNNDILLDFSVSANSVDGTKTKIEEGDSVLPGDSLIFNFSVNKTGFVTILACQEGKSAILLYPNDFSKNIKIETGQIETIPADGSSFKIVASGGGSDTFFMIYTEKKPRWLNKVEYFSGLGFKTTRQGNTAATALFIRDRLMKEADSKWKMSSFKIVNENIN